MPTDPIPIPLRPAAPAASVLRSQLTFGIGQKRYAIDIEVWVSELKPLPAEVISITRRSTMPAKPIAGDSPTELSPPAARTLRTARREPWTQAATEVRCTKLPDVWTALIVLNSVDVKFTSIPSGYRWRYDDNCSWQRKAFTRYRCFDGLLRATASEVVCVSANRLVRAGGNRKIG